MSLISVQYEEISRSSNHTDSNHNKGGIINVKGCSQEIYFDTNSKSQSGKYSQVKTQDCRINVNKFS
jgi:hypothetical protein